MRIDSSSTIAGHPSLVVRKLFRRGSGRLWGLALIAEVLGVTPRVAKRTLRDLESLGYIEKREEFHHHDVWENTVKGNSLAMASAARPIRREVAERKLQEFMQRVRHVNANEYFLYRVTKVIVFGSYLSLKKHLNDIDVAVELIPKVEDKETFNQISRKRRDDAWQAGRNFQNILEDLMWPQTEVKRYLKSRSRIFSIHDTDDGVLRKGKSLVLYSESVKKRRRAKTPPK